VCDVLRIANAARRLTATAIARHAYRVVIVRWLSPVVIVLALLAQTATYATAGVKNVVMCCCPSIDQCNCHEHDEPIEQSTMGRCGGAVEQLAPINIAFVPPTAPAPRLVAEQVALVEYALPIPSQADPRKPEKPPF
jgi:hypothetical protein